MDSPPPQRLLPQHPFCLKIWVVIQGGDHAQFGWYGAQSGDNPATISREAQQAQIEQATVDFLKTLQ
jgi:hypothetical protein